MDSNTGEHPVVRWPTDDGMHESIRVDSTGRGVIRLQTVRDGHAVRRKAIPMTGKVEAVIAYVTMTILAAQQTPTITVDEALRIWALIGSIGGGLCGSLMIASLTKEQRAVRWFVSSFAGFAASSPTLRYFSMEFEPDNIFAVSAILAFSAWALLRLLQEEGPAYIRAKFAAGRSNLEGREDDKP